MTNLLLYQRIAQQLADDIRRGVYQPGERVPSVRKLSAQMSVSHATVLQAYANLEDQGLIRARPQSGFYVHQSAALTAQTPDIATVEGPALVTRSSIISQVLSESRTEGVLPLGAAVPHSSYLPVRALQQQVAEHGPQLIHWVARVPDLDAALAVYRRDFQPSEALAKPHVMVAMNVFAAETEAEARLLASSQQQSFVRLRSGSPGKLPPPIEGYTDTLPSQAQAMLAHIGQAAAVGTPAQVREGIAAFVARTGADEIILSGATYDPQARIRSLEMTLDACRAMVAA